MQETILIVISTAILTSMITLFSVYVLYIRKIKPGLDVQIAKAGDELEERVKAGVVSAGRELLPEFRDKVTEGFTRALAEWPSSEMTKMAKTGANLVEEGLNTLLGKKFK